MKRDRHFLVDALVNQALWRDAKEGAKLRMRCPNGAVSRRRKQRYRARGERTEQPPLLVSFSCTSTRSIGFVWADCDLSFFRVLLPLILPDSGATAVRIILEHLDLGLFGRIVHGC